MKSRGHKKTSAPASTEVLGNVNHSRKNVMEQHTEVNEKLNDCAQKLPVTVEHWFAACNPDRTPILAVRAGISTTDALSEASCILTEIKELLSHTAMQDINLGPAQLWLLFRNVEMAKAVVDSAHEGLERAA